MNSNNMTDESFEDEMLYWEPLEEEPDCDDENSNEFMFCESTCEKCTCGKLLDDSAYYGGSLYNDIISEFNLMGQTRSKSKDSVWIEACKGDLYCISMYYNFYFDINNTCGEEIHAMMQLLKLGVEAGFWLANLQFAYFIEELRGSMFSGIFAFEKYGSPLDLMKFALENYTRVHRLLSTQSEEDIRKEIMVRMLAI